MPLSRLLVFLLLGLVYSERPCLDVGDRWKVRNSWGDTKQKCRAMGKIMSSRPWNLIPKISWVCRRAFDLGQVVNSWRLDYRPMNLSQAAPDMTSSCRSGSIGFLCKTNCAEPPRKKSSAQKLGDVWPSFITSSSQKNKVELNIRTTIINNIQQHSCHFGQRVSLMVSCSHLVAGVEASMNLRQCTGNCNQPLIPNVLNQFES